MGFGGTGLLVLIIILAIVTGGTDEDDGTEATASPTATPSPAATPKPARQWTAEELLECDTTTLARQREGRSLPGELLSDCEVALAVAQYEGVGFMASEDALPKDKRTELMEHVGNISETTREIQGINLNSHAAVVACTKVPTWKDRVDEAVKYLESHSRPELLGWEVDVLRAKRFVDNAVRICKDVRGDTGNQEQRSMTTASASDVPKSTPSPTPLPPGAERLVVTVQTRFYGSSKEWADELRKDPCFVSQTEKNGITTTIWNEDCRSERRPGVAPPYMPFGKLIPDFNRDDWGSWTDPDGDCQDTRQEVLISEAVGHITYEDSLQCRVQSSRWISAYTGKGFENPGALEIDHLVPLANAHKSGAWEWDQDERESYFNDLELESHLIAVEAGANQSKGSRGPEEWKPPLESYWCRYATDWIEVKNKWELTVTPEEADALEDMLATCEPAMGLQRKTKQ